MKKPVRASYIPWGPSATAKRDLDLEKRHESMEELFALHSPRAVTLAYLITGEKALAEDLSQEAFVRVMGRFADRRGPEAFCGYLRKTIINLSRSHFRRQRIYDRAVGGPHPVIDTTDNSQPDALDDELRPLLLRLPHMQRAAIVLRFYEDLSESEAARLLGCSEGAIRSAVYRGMQTLRRQLGSEA